MTREEADFIGAMNMCDEISNEAYKKIMCHCEEQQPCEDCITKAEVINTIHKTIYGFFDIADDDSEEPINDKDKLLLTINKAISNEVKALPSVKPQPKNGEWIDTDDTDEWWGGIYRCSICGEEMIGRYSYCPGCGAEMDWIRR